MGYTVFYFCIFFILCQFNNLFTSENCVIERLNFYVCFIARLVVFFFFSFYTVSTIFFYFFLNIYILYSVEESNSYGFTHFEFCQ